MLLLWFAAFVSAWAIHTIILINQDPLKQYPGPWLARWTNIWRLWDSLSGMHRSPSLVRLHQKYGDIVRVGPKTLSFSNPTAIQDIFGTGKHFPKSKFYYTAAASTRGVVTPSLFSSLDVAWHDNLKRAVNPAFNLSALVRYEPYVSRTVEECIHQLESRFADRSGRDGIIELHKWMHYYAFDVIGDITYGAPYGFLNTGSDVEDMIKHTRKFLVYHMQVGYMPILDKLLLKNPILLWFNQRGLFNSRQNPAVAWALKNQAAHLSGAIAHADGRTPLIEKFIQAKEKNPDFITDKEVLGMGLSMVFAGYETTAITLTAIFYFLLKNPTTYSKLRFEIDAVFPNPTTSIPFHQAHKLPYLDACIKETFRLHPAARFSAERVLPPSGATISGHFIPGNTIVSMNAWPLHRREEIFGEKIETFRPERWLNSSPTMERTLFQFGAGTFMCIGRNISLLEMYKLVPALLLQFDFELNDPNAEWKFEEGSFVNVSLPGVRVKRRIAVN